MMKGFLLAAAICVVTSGCSEIKKVTEASLSFWTPAPTASASAVAPSITLAPKPKPTPSPAPTPIPIIMEDLSKKAMSHLTGLYIDKENAERRPFAVVINNLKKALPQSGIGQAEVCYEVLAEGDITRIIAIFQDFNSGKIGPVRSARDYFLDFAQDNDAVFVHHGGSDAAYVAIKNRKYNDFDGMRDAATFWRDQNRMNQPGMYEHSSYTNAAKLFETIGKKGFRQDLHESSKSMFSFYAVNMSPGAGIPASKITVPFSSAYTSVFEYDASSKQYLKFNGKEKHIDEEIGEQLSYANVIIQFVDMYVIANDSAGRRNVSLVGSGKGFIATSGEYAPITWRKKSSSAATEWFDERGERLKINKGKTWICVYKGNVSFE